MPVRYVNLIMYHYHNFEMIINNQIKFVTNYVLNLFLETFTLP